MSNLYLIRTAAVVSLAAALLGFGWMGMPGDEGVVAPETLAVSAPPASYYPAEFELRPNPDEPEVYEYY